MTQSETSIRMLLERLNWPVRLVRWRAAREIAALFEIPDCAREARTAFLEWLAGRTLESEVTSGLAVLLCADWSSRPAFPSVSAATCKPSILADLMLQHVYGWRKGGWDTAHSGAAPATFTPPIYFLENQSAQVPPILRTVLRRAERESGIPLNRQWAFEWQHVMERTGSPHSGYPYHFVDTKFRNAGVIGQLSLRQCGVYRSAFLRTLAFAVSECRMSLAQAAYLSSYTLPLNPGLAELDPRPELNRFLCLGERCCAPEQDVVALAREAIALAAVAPGMQPVALRIPVRSAAAEFGELTIHAVLATDDFEPSSSDQPEFPPSSILVGHDMISFAGPRERRSADEFICAGKRGRCLPLCERVWPASMGFWLNDYFQIGIILPATHLFNGATSVECSREGISVISGGETVGKWQVWHDHWTPLYPPNGATGCGALTELRELDVRAAARKHSLCLGWIARRRLWRRKTDYGEFEITEASTFFRD